MRVEKPRKVGVDMSLLVSQGICKGEGGRLTQFLNNLPNMNPGGLFPKTNLEPLPFCRLYDSFYFSIDQAAACQLNRDVVADFIVLHLGSGQPESNTSP